MDEGYAGEGMEAPPSRQVAVVAGGSVDVGRAYALRVAGPGTTVVVVDADRDKVTGVCDEIAERGGRGVPVVLDPGDLDSLARLPDLLPATIDHCRTLVNCQFDVDLGDIHAVDLATWERVLRSNLTGPFILTKALLPLLSRAEGASVINVGSIDGVLGNPWLPAYSVSKGGLITLTHVLAHELGRTGIRVNYVARSGTVEAQSVLRNAPNGERLAPDCSRKLSEKTPLGRIGLADETAAVVEFLASSQASFVNGTVVTVDGGRSVVTPGTV